MLSINKETFLFCCPWLGLGLVIFWMIQQPHIRINQESYNRIRNGMTLSSVEKIIGRPPGEYTTSRCYVLDMRSKLEWAIPVKDKDWIGDEFGIRVTFDGDDKVVSKQQLKVIRFRNSHFDSVRRWLRLISPFK